MRLIAIAAATLAATVLAAPTAHAQEWPAKPVRVVVPFPAGGSTDRMTRLVADELTRVFKQQFVVENRPGAGGAVGAAQVARAEADGYTLMAGGFGPHILGPASGVKADYHPIADFTHIVMMGGETYIFGAHSALGVKTIADVVRLANDKPVNFGSPGTGTLGQLMVDQFRLKVGANRINHVPYRGGAPLQTDFIGNHVSLATLQSRRCCPTSRPARSSRSRSAPPNAIPLCRTCPRSTRPDIRRSAARSGSGSRARRTFRSRSRPG